MAIGEIILAAFLEVLFEKLASGLSANFAQEEVLDTQLKKLSKTLLIIQAVIDDAEEKQITDRAVKMWLEDLNDVAYDLDDLLDEFATEALRRKLMDQKRPHASTSKVRKLIPTCCTSFSPSAFMFDRHMRSKIEQINARLQDIAAQKNDLGLEKNAGAVRERLPQPAWANKSDVYGREKDKEAVLDLLLRDHASDDGLCVIPIVGMAGVGKTTLAQLVYDDDSLESHFALKAWAYVSHDFDAFKVAKTVLESVTSVAWNFEDQNMLMNELKESLSGKMFLVVLDDIWNENPIECDNLLCPFLVGAPGSKIIITTRNDNVASMMRTVPALYLKKLNDDDCLSLFAQNALQRRNFDAHPDLKEVGEKIVKKCDGLPLAAKTLGGLLRKELCQYEWENILNSKIWELSPGRSGILPALRLSYHHLSSHLKQCFAYCSIFPKGYEFDKEEVILLWMAEGLLQLSKGKKRMMEDFGRDCFNGLLSMSFFQQSSGNKTKFVMHDLVNDLAQFVAGEICFRLLDKFEDNVQYTIPKCARHLSYTRESYEAFQKFNALCEVKHLRTFLPFHVHGSCSWPTSYLTNRVLFDLLPKLHCLRVLSLSGYHINKLPDSIDNLKYLRYLNLSYTSIKWLPQSLGTLYNLETLLLRGCDCLCMLPSNIVNLINMRHLDNSDTKLLQEMPLGIGSLTNLQTLSKLIVGKGKGSRLSELKNLLHLRGMLSIVNLQNIMDVREAKEANLMDKPDLDELQLSWCKEFDDSRNKKLEMDVLDMLKPHRNLKMLKVEFFGGMTFPSWIGDLSFSKMVNVNLIGCTKCKCLPPLGQLAMLKYLYIQGMHEVKSVGAKFYTDRSLEFPFPSLETLTFEDMPEWEEWSFLDGVEITARQFPCLRVLTIRKCPKLSRVSILRLSSLCELHLEECNEVVLKSVTDLTSLTTLKVQSVSGLSKLPEVLIQFLVALEYLEFDECDQLVTLWQEEEISPLPCKLERLELRHCANLEKLPNGLNNLTSLKCLSITGCPKLVHVPERGVPPMLTYLRIEGCNGLKSLPDGISHLEDLRVGDCSSLRLWPTNMFPTTLKRIRISNCMQLEWVSETIMVHENSSMSSLEGISISHWPNIGSLVGRENHFANLLGLWIYDCNSLECFPERGLSIPNLRCLIIRKCVNLKSLPPFNQIQSLTCLGINGCPNLELFGNGDRNLPPKLVEISVDADYGMPLSEWGLQRLTSLEKFHISGGFLEMVCFPDDDEEEMSLFPASLTLLRIWNLRNLESISSKGLRNLTSLQYLSIYKCPKLRSFPKEGLPSTLQSLQMSICPILKERCAKDRGNYWPIIADIPCVTIDGRYIYEEELRLIP